METESTYCYLKKERIHNPYTQERLIVEVGASQRRRDAAPPPPVPSLPPSGEGRGGGGGFKVMDSSSPVSAPMGVWR